MKHLLLVHFKIAFNIALCVLIYIVYAWKKFHLILLVKLRRYFIAVTRKWFILFRLLSINFILLSHDIVLIVEQFRDSRTKEASIEALVKLHRSYSGNLGVLVARYYIRFHPRNSCCQLNFKFLRHPTFDGDVDTIDDLLSHSESALSSL